MWCHTDSGEVAAGCAVKLLTGKKEKRDKTLPEVDISCVNLRSMNLGTCIMLCVFNHRGKYNIDLYHIRTSQQNQCPIKRTKNMNPK